MSFNESSAGMSNPEQEKKETTLDTLLGIVDKISKISNIDEKDKNNLDHLSKIIKLMRDKIFLIKERYIAIYNKEPKDFDSLKTFLQKEYLGQDKGEYSFLLDKYNINHVPAVATDKRFHDKDSKNDFSDIVILF